MSAYAAQQVRRVLAAGPNEGEDFFRLKVSGDLASHHVNVTPEQLSAIADILDTED